MPFVRSAASDLSALVESDAFFLLSPAGCWSLLPAATTFARRTLMVRMRRRRASYSRGNKPISTCASGVRPSSAGQRSINFLWSNSSSTYRLARRRRTIGHVCRPKLG
ncbi:hypothetical protein KCV07_g366, partial [Aureobasidium melanogenum]